MSLKVKVNDCKDLPNIEKIGEIDPYVVLTFRGIEKKTSVIDDCVNPVWDNEEFEWTLQSSLNPSEVLKIEVYDEQTVGRNRLVGSVDYSVSQLWGQKNKDESLSLTPSKQAAKLKGAEKATINLSFVFTSLSDQVGQARKTAGRVGGGGGGGGGDEEGEEGDEFYDEGNYGEGEGGIGEGGIETGANGGGGVVGGRRKKAVRHPKLPDKPTDFQIRIHIVEGRRLEGNNICPMVKVSCGDETQKTSVRRGTNSPVFDETLIFNFKERPVELFEKKIEIKVLDTAGKIKNSIIGVFSLDIGTVYYEPKHTFFHKWVLLTHQDDPSLGARGFVKATLSVLGPEDDPIHSTSDISADDVDIESNLLRPSGVRLEAATLSVKIYSAEDLPQMDPGYFEKFKSILNFSTGKKELVDPFCNVAFAGHKISTDVKWNTQSPQWNEQVNIGFRFPTICERLRFELKDKDKLNADDFIGTCIIKIPEITAPGDNGFLPTFGPCHVNVYGSPREFTDLPDQYDHLNKGLFEGVAYRGRVLLEISTTLGSLPGEKKEFISPAEQRKLQLFQKRHKFVLSAIFMSASMIQCSKGEIQFEVSVGNYGYSVDSSTVAQASTTHPTYPIYDGRNYSYMPWYSSKPLVLLESYWEDCRYRIESLNLLINATNTLNKGLESVKRLLRLPEKFQQLVPERLALLCDELLNNIMSLRLNLPKLPDVFNKLDKQLRKYREEEISALCPIVDTLAAEVAQKLSPGQTMTNEDIDKYIEELQYVLEQMKSLCVEPQNCIPDVIIWMLVDGKRVASHRIPSHVLMYSRESGTRGNLCGKMQTIQLNPPAVIKDKHRDGNKDSCLLQLILWMGNESDRSACYDNPDGPGGEMSTFAETYENEAFYGVWGTGKKLACYAWSDASGKVKLNKEYFEPPPNGWKWDSEWFIDPEDDQLSKMEAATVTVDVYEIQSREPFSPWPMGHESIWADTSGLGFMNFDTDGEEKPMTKGDIDKEIPAGWQWISQWVYITDGPVSSDGWEYTTARYDPVEGLSNGTEFAAIERNEHITRRRKWARTREKKPDAVEIKTEREPLKDKGWMYARRTNSSFHSGKQKLDFFRRRRWHRSLSCEDVGRPAVFYILRKRDKKKREERDRRLTEPDGEGLSVDSSGLGYQFTPKTYLTFKSDEYTCYQLRAYLYQARDLYAADNTGLSDPYVVVSCGNVSGKSKILNETLSPKWNETLVLNNIRFYGNPRSVHATPPTVALELYDKDIIGHNEYLGMIMVPPTVRMTPDTESPVLEWFPITRYDKPAGEILAAFELIRTGSQGWEPPQLEKDGEGPSYLIPTTIAPETQTMRIEVLCWGVRDMKRYLLLPINHPLVEVEVGGEAKDTAYIKDLARHPMFPRPILIFDAELPVESVYSPPLNIRVFDKRKFGYSPLVGNCTITSLKQFEEEDVIKKPRSIHPRSAGTLIGSASKEDVVIDLESLVTSGSLMFDGSYEDDYRFDWWSKYYASIGETGRVQEGYMDENHDHIKEYEKELETYFDHFSDLAQTFPLHRGKGQQAVDDSTAVGFFKGAIKVYKKTSEVNKFSSQLPIKWPQEVTVRVYIIRGFDLQPKDIGGSSDPYIKISVGKKEISDKENFIPSQLNPLFGKTFEVDALLPFDRTLTVTVMDHDFLSADDIIGTTTIDLENRFLSLHRPLCGLPQTFCKSGCNRWRDVMSPVDILNAYCTLKEFPAPVWNGTSTVSIDHNTYTLEQFEKDVKLNPNIGDEKSRLALHILRSCEADFVPEHIEKRTLYSPVQPGVPQGHLHMWVDIFPKLPNVVIPPKVDITPRKADKYVLRIIVWNTSDVILDERSAVTGDDMSDIYVKGWFNGSDDVQKTDVHYRSMDGDGMFNWRLVFPFEYIRPEKKMLVSVKEHFYSLSKTERRLPVRFNLQVWDNDLLNPDDFLGNVEFDLHHMPLPAKTKRRCRLRILEDDDRSNKFVDLFQQKHVKGWLPVFQENYPAERGRDQRGNKTLTGKVEVEMEILTEEEEKARPAGKGRDEPNQNPVLQKPDRPELSFAWYASPLKSFKFLIWRHHKKKIIFGIILLIIFFSVLMLL